MENSCKEEHALIELASDATLEGAISTWESSAAAKRGQQTWGTRSNRQRRLGHHDLRCWPWSGNKRTGSSCSERALAVAAPAQGLATGRQPCCRQSTARRSLDAIPSLCTAPEATCGRVPCFRPPSTRVSKLESVWRATDVWGLTAYQRLRELG